MTYGQTITPADVDHVNPPEDGRTMRIDVDAFAEMQAEARSNHASILAAAAKRVVESHRSYEFYDSVTARVLAVADADPNHPDNLDLQARIAAAAADPQPAPSDHDESWDYVLPERYQG